jgi:hypothetical protein
MAPLHGYRQPSTNGSIWSCSGTDGRIMNACALVIGLRSSSTSHPGLCKAWVVLQVPCIFSIKRPIGCSKYSTARL